jgi:hypothetical protein
MQKPTHHCLSSSVKSGGTIGSGNHGGGSCGRGCGCQGGFSSLGFRPTGGSCLGGCGGRGCGRTTGGGVGKVGGAGSVGALGGLGRTRLGGNGRTGNRTRHSAHANKHAPHRICTGRGSSLTVSSTHCFTYPTGSEVPQQSCTHGTIAPIAQTAAHPHATAHATGTIATAGIASRPSSGNKAASDHARSFHSAASPQPQQPSLNNP